MTRRKKGRKLPHLISWKIRRPHAEKNDKDESVPDVIKIIDRINQSYDTRRNIVTGRTEIRHCEAGPLWHEVNDEAINTLVVEFKSNKVYANASSFNTIFNSKYVKIYDPIQAYLESLPSWDGRDRISELAKTITCQDVELWDKYLRKWLVALVRCSIRPDVTNQHILVLQGPQGIGKTRWVHKLIPSVLQNYFFTGKTDFEDQVFLAKLGRYFMIFLDELDSYSGPKMAVVKSAITQEKIRYRPLYSSYDVEVPRRASFIAAINNEKFIHDESGSRRFLVVGCLSINHSHNIDMNMVFAQAYHLAQDRKFIHHFSGVDQDQIEKNNSNHRVKDPADDLIEKYLQPCSADDPDAKFLTATEVLKKLSEKDVKLKTTANAIGLIMTRLKFGKTSDGTGDDKRYGYIVKTKK